MELSLELYAAIAATIAFWLGYYIGKITQSSTERQNVYGAIAEASRRLEEKGFVDKKPTDWAEGTLDALETTLHCINNKFYGNRPNE